MSDEYDAKNISHEGGGTEAVGVDVSRYLPGLYWLNFFGKPYCELIGLERLLDTPAHEVKGVDDGVLVRLSKDSREWEREDYREAERKVLNHIGRQYCFSKEEPNQKTVAPDFGLPRE